MSRLDDEPNSLDDEEPVSLLSDEDRRRIFEEEKVRFEARAAIEAQARLEGLQTIEPQGVQQRGISFVIWFFFWWILLPWFAFKFILIAVVTLIEAMVEAAKPHWKIIAAAITALVIVRLVMLYFAQ